MKNIISLTVVVIIFVSSLIIGQDSTQNSLKQGKFALQFQLEGSFTVKPFQESSFSGKYHFKDLSAIRLGFQIYNSTEVEKTKNGIDTSKSSSFNFRINAQYIYYLMVVDDMCLFTGGGLSYGKRIYRYQNNWPEQDSWEAGLSALIGMEWFVKKNISLSGEYSLILNYSDEYYKGPDRGQIVELHAKKVFLSSYNQFKIGISLYL